MTPRLLAAIRCAERLPPHEQDELADRILADVAPELVRSRAWRPGERETVRAVVQEPAPR